MELVSWKKYSKKKGDIRDGIIGAMNKMIDGEMKGTTAQLIQKKIAALDKEQIEVLKWLIPKIVDLSLDSILFMFEGHSELQVVFRGVDLKVDLDQYCIQKLDFNNLKYKEFREDYIKLSEFNVYKIYELEKRAFIESSFSEVAFIEYQKQIEVFLTINKESFHDFESIDHYIAKIGEEKIVVIYKEKRNVYYPENGYRYLRGKFIKKEKNIYLYLLSSHNSILSIKIEKYKLS